tara:strand:- start:257 stop:466 length:210 start_codon:yes stop_codon:yes gene_type:complete
LQLSKIKGENDFMVDEESGAIINTNITEIEKSKERKKILRAKNQEFQTLKAEVSDIKNLLVEITRKLGD